MIRYFQATSFEVLTREVWHLAPNWHGSQHRPIMHFVCGGVAGVFSSIISFPFDVVRTRLVAQGEPKVSKVVGWHLHSSQILSLKLQILKIG